MPALKKFFTDKTGAAFFVLLLLLLASVLFSLLFGAVEIDFVSAVCALLRGEDSPGVRILLHSRLPRTIAPVLSGAAFAVSGVLIQGMMNNALASPNIIGVNSGAGLFCVLTAALFPALPRLIPAASFVGAFGTTLLVYFVGVKTGASRLTLLLSGVAVGTTLSALTNAVRVFFPSVISGTSSFFIGGFSGVTLSTIFPAGFLILFGIFASFFLARPLDILNLGEETAKSLGLPVMAVRFLIMADASMLAGAAVSFSGLLGFVGLSVPHIARNLFGTAHRRLLPASALLGAAFLTLCDTLSRLIFAPFELPVGVLTSLIGGPFFIWLLIRRQRRRVYD